MVPLYAARVSDLGPGDFLRVECVCGHEMLIPHASLLHGLRLRPDDAQGIREEGLWLG